MTEPAGLYATKSDYAYTRLRDGILSGEFEPGTVLHQATLAKTIGISTTPLREAMRRLMTEGLVELDAHHRREDALADVRRIDADDGHARTRHGAAGHGDLVVECARAADHLPALEGGVHAPVGERPAEPLEFLVGGVPRPVLADRADRVLVLGGAPARTNPGRH